MATIQKVSGIDFANISKFDGVDISAVGSINFIGKPATGNLLLDTSYGSGAEAAYSVRKLRTAYTGAAIQVQATTGGATAEIGFDVDNNLDTATLLAFAGTNEVRVSIWYDQSLNGNNATQTSVAQRPIVVAAGGALVKENGKLALDFGGTSQLDFTTIAKVDVDPFAVFTVAQDTPNNLLFVDSTDNHNDALLVFTSYGQMRSRWNASVYIDFINSDSLYRLFSVIDDGTNPVNYYYSGELVTDAAYPVTNKAINLNRIGGTGYQASQQYAGIMQEAIFYASNKSSVRTDIEENIGDYYTQNPAPYLLDTYTGAAAAYSLRKLRTDYTGFAIKVQDNVGGATQDIGFNVFGELDTVSLLQYAGSNDVFVETWYDQSGSGNNATQISSGARPQIVSSGAVIVENGKPIVLGGSGDWLRASTYTGNSAASVFSVIKRNHTANIIISKNGNPFALVSDQGSTNTVIDSAMGTVSYYQDGTAAGFTTRGDVYTETANQVAISFFGSTASYSLLDIGYPNTSATFPMYSMQELIIYNSDQSTNRTGIETNINTFYNIYTPTPDPLLLNLYPGSAAAYSLRKLNANYTGSAILVQDTVGGATKAIGFDANGDLDTAELLAYAGSNDVLVATWFDQSGSGNNATQGSSGARPKIVSSGTVIVDANGKPTVQFNGSKSIGIGNYSSLTEGELFTTVRWLGDTSTRGGFKISTNGFDMHFPYYGGLVYDNFGSTSRYVFTPSITLNQINLYNTLSKSSEWTARLNSNVEYTSATNTVGFSSGQIGSWTMNHNFSEFILYNAVQSTANRTDIETNIGGYYDIPLAGLLDENPGAAAAYSLRRLSSTYTGSAIQVQRADNVGGTHNIGFDSYGELDTTALTTAAAGNSMVVTTWFDQSGSGNDATQGSSLLRPKIYDATTGVIVDDNGKPAVEFDGSNDGLLTSGTTLMHESDYTAIFLARTNNVTSTNVFISGGSSGTKEGRVFFHLNDRLTQGFLGASTGSNLQTITANTQNLYYSENTGFHTGETYETKVYLDGGNLATATGTGLTSPTGTSTFAIGINGHLNSGTLDGKIQETIIYPSVITANRPSIEDNIGDYYGIEIAGLLDQYSGAAAAYSLRKLSNSYTGSAVRVQRADNVGGTTDIGFNADGGLDTDALTTAAAGNSMVVTTWFDQSGSGNNATQGTSLSRPKIYDATTGVIVDGNGALTISYDASNDFMETALTLNTEPISVFAVNQTPNGSYAPIVGLGGVTAYLNLEIQNAQDANLKVYAGNGSTYTAHASSTGTSTDVMLYSYSKVGNALNGYVNGAQEISATETRSSSGVLGFRVRSRVTVTYISEVVIYQSDQSGTAQTGIEDNINFFYDIY